MAQGKNSFVLYTDWVHTFSKLTDEEAGKLIKHLLSYVNDEDPTLDDRMLEILFEPIKQSLKRDLRKREDVKNTKSDNGKLGNLKRRHEDLYNKVCDHEITLDKAISIAEGRKVSQCDNSIANVAVSVTVPVSDSDSVNDKKNNNINTQKSIIVSKQVELFMKKQSERLPTVASRMSEKYLQDQQAEYDKVLKNMNWLGYEGEKLLPAILEYVLQEEFRCDQIQSIAKLRRKNKEKVPYWLVMVEKMKLEQDKKQAAVVGFY